MYGILEIHLLRNAYSWFIFLTVQVTDMVLLFLAKKRVEDGAHAALLENSRNRLQVASNPADISNELDSLSKILDQMESLSIDGK